MKEWTSKPTAPAPVHQDMFFQPRAGLSSTEQKPVQRKEAPETEAKPVFDFKIGAPVGQGVVTVDSLNVRKGPGTNYAKTGRILRKGTSVTLYGTVEGWHCIGTGEWVTGQYISTPPGTATNLITSAMAKVRNLIFQGANLLEKSKVESNSSNETVLNEQLVNFIADLKKDPTYGKKVTVTSGVRDAKTEARAVLNNQRSNPEYYKIFSANWQKAILTAVKDRNLQLPADFAAAIESLAAWILEAPLQRSPHVSGKAIDFGLAGGDKDFKTFLKTEAEKRNLKFIDESAYNHYHIQMAM